MAAVGCPSFSQFSLDLNGRYWEKQTFPQSKIGTPGTCLTATDTIRH